MDPVILAIDCGTQSLRSLLFSPNGELLDKATIEYAPYTSPRPGWAEQDPEMLWQSLCQACNALAKNNPRLFARVTGMGVTTQRDSMVNVDRDGNPLRPIITWLDQRKARPLYSPGWLMRAIYRVVGMQEAIAKIQADGKCNWIRQNQPDIWKQTYKYLQVSGFLNHRLTGDFVDSLASQIGHIPFDYKKQNWSSDGSLNALLLPLENEKRVRLVKPGEAIGTVTKKASEQTGIPSGIPVVACGSDKGCETVGMGVFRKSMANLSFGTTATVQTTTDKYSEPLRFMPSYPAPIPDHFNPEVEIFRGFWMVRWFKNEFAHKEILEARARGTTPESLLDELLTQVPPGSMGLVVQPYWSPGLKTPSAKGAMIGFGDVHTRAHVYRALIEGLAFALLDGLHKIEKACKTTVQLVAVSGGASKSDAVCQLTSDIFNLPLVRGKTHETSGLGAAMVTAVGLGIHSSFQAAVEDMVAFAQEFTPITENTAIYREMYQRVYRKMYESLEPLYKEIRDITGYPERAEPDL